MPLKTVSKKLADLTPDPFNVRAHGSKNLASIVGSLRQFGQVEPLVVQKKTGAITGGNGRFEAMRQLGWEKADCVEVDFDALHARALGLALNRTAELAEWDNHKLEALVSELQADSFDLDGIGFDEDDVAKLVKDFGDDTQKEEDADPKLGENLTYSVIVTLPNEAEQALLLEELEGRGLSCKMLVS